MNFARICLAADVLIAVAVYFVYLVPKWNELPFSLFTKTAFYVYGIFVLYFTCLIPIFIPIPFFNVDIANIHVNTIPFVDYINSYGDAVRQIILNVLMTVPFGIMYPYICKKNFRETMLAGLGASIGIELLQLFSVRQFSSCDITDVITNVTGVLIGFVIFQCLGIPVNRLLNKLLSGKQLKKYAVSSRSKAALAALIAVLWSIRSVLIVYI